MTRQCKIFIGEFQLFQVGPLQYSIKLKLCGRSFKIDGAIAVFYF